MAPLPHLAPHTEPAADPAAVIYGPSARFTVLTPRLIRLETSPDGVFEDRASQAIWFRRQPVPDFTATTANGIITIDTPALTLTYDTSAEGFTPDSLSVTVKANGAVWRFGDAADRNLGGTARTLDGAPGPVPLEPGLLARAGWTLVDDSASLVLDEAGWIAPRGAAPGALDLYFFAYGDDYQAALDDFCRIAGPVPMVPRWALGNWWSRYWPYTQNELAGLMLDFKAYEIPLSVCIIDMEWHITQTGNASSGWTGYTWNRELFPDPPGFLSFLHEQGLHTALNLHPADGIHPHEEAYPEMARRLGIDPASGEPVPHDLTDPAFAAAYFEVLHHPQEASGVDFWWLDWQQGDKTRLEGLDPLWWLNHLHFLDLGRDGRTRPFIFSRWGGLGNHRYPIGFSGDTWVTWGSLGFQPYFTATAANVGYGWWSHDIGGHASGIEEPELYARWVQYGVFSPIFRLHSTRSAFHERRPWGWDDAEVLRLAREAMQLRHRLIPYLYTMAWRAHTENVLPVRPMYHEHPRAEEAYLCPQQYTFGSELIAAPFTTPRDPDTGLSRQVVWLPDGDWYHFFTGESMPGGWHAVYGRLDETPVFARAGAIVPLAPRTGWGGVDNPAELDVHVFAGADNCFVLYEDDGVSLAYRDGAACRTEIAQAWEPGRLAITIGAAEGDRSLIPARRRWRLYVHGVRGDASLTVDQPHHAAYDSAAESWIVELEPLPVTEHARLVLEVADGALRVRRDRTAERLVRMLRSFKLLTVLKDVLLARLDDISADPNILAEYTLHMTPSQRRALIEVITGAGMHRLDVPFEAPRVLLWNPQPGPGARYTATQTDRRHWAGRQRYQTQREPIPTFAVFAPDPAAPDWQVTAHFFDVLTLEEGSKT